MAGPCDKVIYGYFSKGIPCLSKDIEERWKETGCAACNARLGYVMIGRAEYKMSRADHHKVKQQLG